jgi:cytochrome c553
MMIRWKHVLLAAIAAPLLALLVAWSGVIYIGATGGHWSITSWFLHYVMRQSIATYAIPVEEPEIIDPGLLVPAAGHFQQGCAFCHGAPGEQRSATVMKMLPQPPDLTTVLSTWSDEELFRIVRNGVRYSGMPAWPTQERDDEVWGLVAFLRQMNSMDAETYQALTQQPASGNQAAGSVAFERALSACAACHNLDGSGRSSAIPILAGQSETYLLNSLHAYADGSRASGYMQTAATLVDRALYAELAAYFAAQTEPAPPPVDAPNDVLELGRRIAEQGLPDKEVPACLSCHGSTRKAAYPSLDGQHRDYLVRQLVLFAEEHRGGTPFNHLMIRPAKGLSEPEREAVAAYFASRRR